MCEKKTKIQRRRHNLVGHSTGWGTQKDSALWIKAERYPKAWLN